MNVLASFTVDDVDTDDTCIPMTKGEHVWMLLQLGWWDVPALALESQLTSDAGVHSILTNHVRPRCRRDGVELSTRSPGGLRQQYQLVFPGQASVPHSYGTTEIQRGNAGATRTAFAPLDHYVAQPADADEFKFKIVRGAYGRKDPGSYDTVYVGVHNDVITIAATRGTLRDAAVSRPDVRILAAWLVPEGEFIAQWLRKKCVKCSCAGGYTSEAASIVGWLAHQHWPRKAIELVNSLPYSSRTTVLTQAEHIMHVARHDLYRKKKILADYMTRVLDILSQQSDEFKSCSREELLDRVAADVGREASARYLRSHSNLRSYSLV